MMEFFLNIVKPHFNFWVYVILMMIGLWSVIAKNNLIKKLMGLAIFQTAIILFYVSIGVKDEATIPVLFHHSEEQITPVAASFADGFANPVPHVLMLTAIVVGVATLGVALALCQMLYKEFGSIEEDELLRKIKAVHDDA